MACAAREHARLQRTLGTHGAQQTSAGMKAAYAHHMATAGEFCNRQVVFARPGEGLADVAARLLEHRVGCVVVVNEDKEGNRRPVGMLMDRDLVVGALTHGDRHLHSLAVRDVMTTRLVEAWENEPIEDVFRRMRSFGIRRIPVIDEKGALVGLVTFDDWVEFLSEQVHDLATLLERERKHEAERGRSS